MSNISRTQFMQRFAQFKGCPCKWGHNGIVGIQFIYQEQSRMYHAENKGGGCVK